jgi:hypothetical protein
MPTIYPCATSIENLYSQIYIQPNINLKYVCFKIHIISWKGSLFYNSEMFKKINCIMNFQEGLSKLRQCYLVIVHNLCYGLINAS